MNKHKKYRIIIKPSDDIDYPIRYIAQRQTLFGQWINIDWSYNQSSAEEYIERYHRRRNKILPLQFSSKVVKEIEL